MIYKEVTQTLWAGGTPGRASQCLPEWPESSLGKSQMVMNISLDVLTPLPWWGITELQRALRNLSKTLITIANKTATSLANIQKSLDSIAKLS